MRLGYKRVSTLAQNTVRQLDGVPLDKCFEDHASGRSTEARPALAQVIDFAREGDTVIVHSMDRLARNLKDLREIVDQIVAKKAAVQFIKESVTFTGQDSPMSQLLLNLLGAFAEFERSLIRERQREGIDLAKRSKKYKGRKPILNEEDRRIIIGKIAAGITKARIAKEFGVSRETLYKCLNMKYQMKIDCLSGALDATWTAEKGLQTAQHV